MYMIFLSKSWIFKIIITAEIIIAVWYLGWGPFGYKALQKKREHNCILVTQVEQEKKGIEELLLTLQEWKTSLFLQEKYAREKLHMGKKDEIIFFYE